MDKRKEIYFFIDISCTRCEPVIEALTKYGEQYGWDKLEIVEVDDDPARVFRAVKQYREAGFVIEHLPIIAVGPNDDPADATGVLPGFPYAEEIENLLKD
jgi:hypothetical protein